VLETDSPISWSAVLAGAAATLASSFVLVALVGGIGMKLAPPWPGGGDDPLSFTPILGASLMAVQVLASALGGYLTGRLRIRWTVAHSHEVHFRDTAHGFLAWAVSTLAGIVLLAAAPPTLTAPPSQPVVSSVAVINAPAAAAASDSVPTSADLAAARQRAEREANLTAQVSLFMGIGLLLGAFTASVAAALGGMRREEMHTLYWTERVAVAREPR
jgi:hypothetical protein